VILRTKIGKLDEEIPTYTGLAQENDFGSAYVPKLPRLVKGASALCTCKKECNKYDLTAAADAAAQCF
jgi:hypothetical protein